MSDGVPDGLLAKSKSEENAVLDKLFGRVVAMMRRFEPRESATLISSCHDHVSNSCRLSKRITMGP
jgi:hypothetical protein